MENYINFLKTQSEQKHEIEFKGNTRLTNKPLLSAIKAFDTSLKNRTDLAGMLALFTKQIATKPSIEEFKQIITHLQILLQKLIPNLNTLGDNYKFYRKAVLKQFGEGPEYKEVEYVYDPKSTTDQRFGLTRAQQAIRKTEADKRITDKNTNQKVFYAEKLFKTINEFKESKDIFELGVLLQMTAGFRIIELFSREFVKIDDTHIKQIGVAKDKGARKRGEESDRLVIKPLVVLSADEWLNKRQYVIDSVKALGWDLSEKKYQDKWGAGVNKVTSEHICDDCTSHILRSIYGSLAYNLDNTSRTKNTFLKDVLGQEHITNSLSYMVKIIFSHENKSNTQILSKLDMLAADLANMKLEKKAKRADNVSKKGIFIEGVEFVENKRNLPGLAIDRLKITMKKMSDNNIEATNNVLASLGYSRRTITEYKRLKAS